MNVHRLASEVEPNPIPVWTNLALKKFFGTQAVEVIISLYHAIIPKKGPQQEQDYGSCLSSVKFPFVLTQIQIAVHTSKHTKKMRGLSSAPFKLP